MLWNNLINFFLILIDDCFNYCTMLISKIKHQYINFNSPLSIWFFATMELSMSSDHKALITLLSSAFVIADCVWGSYSSSLFNILYSYSNPLLKQVFWLSWLSRANTLYPWLIANFDDYLDWLNWSAQTSKLNHKKHWNSGPITCLTTLFEHLNTKILHQVGEVHRYWWTSRLGCWG